MTRLKILFCQSFVEQHALPRGLESHLVVPIPAFPLSVPRVALPCNQVVVVVVIVVVIGVLEVDVNPSFILEKSKMLQNYSIRSSIRGEYIKK